MKRFQLLALASVAALVCFDNEGGVGTGDGAGDGGTGDGSGDGGNGEGTGAGAGTGAGKTFTQDDVNKFLAEDKRKHKAQMEKLEGQLATLSTSTTLSQQERDELNASLEDVRKQLRTKEQQAALDKQTMETQYKTKLTEAEKKAQEWETKYTSETISRAIQDAAIAGDAFSPGQITLILRDKTKMVNGAPMVDFQDVHAETGQPIITQMTPADAVKRMRDLPDVYGNLFKSYIASGIGGTSKADGIGAGGKVDVSKLTPAQYRKLRAENPEALFGSR